MAEQSKESVKETSEPEVIEVIDVQDEVVVESEDSNDDTIENLKETIKSLEQEKNETYERYLRAHAEFENFKKRTQRERIAERKYKSQDLVNELLPALDNFERALEVEVTNDTKSIVDGISMVYNQFKNALESEDIEVIETVGKEFDPNLHHAVMQVEDENFESNIVTEELQKGYILKDRVIRAAMVKVNK